MRKNNADRIYLGVIVAMAVALSLGCFVFTDDPRPEPADDQCNGVDAIPTLIEEDFTADDDCGVVDELIVVDGARLSVQPGTTLEFRAGAGIHVRDDGSLYARGDDDEPVEFRGINGDRGSWMGILFDQTTNRDNIIESATVEGGGEASWDGQPEVGPANVTVVDGRAELVDVDLRESAGHGLDMSGDSRVTIGGENQWTENALEPVRTTPALVDVLTSEVSYRNNDADAIYVREGTISDDARWARFDVPIRITGVIVVEANLTIASGNELSFDEGAGVDVGENGNMEMEGDDDDIRLRGTDSVEPDEDIEEVSMDGDLRLRSICVRDGESTVDVNDNCP